MVQKEQLDILKFISLIVAIDIGGVCLCIIMCGGFEGRRNNYGGLTSNSSPQFRPFPQDTAHC